MSEREILFNMSLAAFVIAAVIFVFLIGGMPTVAVAAVLTHHWVQKIESQRAPIHVVRDENEPPPKN